MIDDVIEKDEFLYSCRLPAACNMSHECKSIIVCSQELVQCWLNQDPNWPTAVRKFSDSLLQADEHVWGYLQSRLPRILLEILRYCLESDLNLALYVFLCIGRWLKYDHETIFDFLASDVLELCCRLIENRGLEHEDILLAALWLMKYLTKRRQIFNEKAQVNANRVLGNDDIVKKLLLYANKATQNPAIRREAFCIIWAILSNINAIPQRAKLFGSLFRSIEDEAGFDIFCYIITAASAFLDCGMSPSYLLPSQRKAQQLLQTFGKLDERERIHLLDFLTRVLQRSDEATLEIFESVLNWEVLDVSFHSQNDEEINYLLKFVVTAFELSTHMIQTAFDSSILEKLLELETSDESSFKCKSFASVALCDAFEKGSVEIRSWLLNAGLGNEWKYYLHLTVSNLIHFHIFMCMPALMSLLHQRMEIETLNAISELVTQELSGKLGAHRDEVKISESAVSELAMILDQLFPMEQCF